MALQLSGDDRRRFAWQLQLHRNGYALTDADYAKSVLGVSLNTYKRCIADTHEPLSFKHGTFIAIFQAAGLDPRSFGLDISLPDREQRLGSYREADFPYLSGRYLLYRRSFLTALNIVRGVLDIEWSTQDRAYAFTETQHYTTDFGNSYDTVNHGLLHISVQHNLMSLSSMQQGLVRLTMLKLPDAPAHAKAAIRTRGAVLTYGNPKDFYQPIVSAVVVDKLLTKAGGDKRALCATLKPGTPEFAALSADLTHAEENAVVMTPLMWARSHQGRLQAG